MHQTHFYILYCIRLKSHMNIIFVWAIDISVWAIDICPAVSDVCLTNDFRENKTQTRENETKLLPSALNCTLTILCHHITLISCHCERSSLAGAGDTAISS
jgi:hypothetical protein